MGVLPTVLTDTRQIALDIAWVVGRLVKGWRKERISPSSRLTNRSTTACIARVAQAGICRAR